MDQNTLHDLIATRRTCRAFSDHPLPSDVLERILWAAQGITDENGNRTAPSAHALHPLRLRLASGSIEGLSPAVYDVSAGEGSLVRVRDGDVRRELMDATIDDQPWIASATAILTIVADMVTPVRDFADQEPLGKRGYRYVYIEAGAAAQNAMLQATADGLGSVLVAGFNDTATAGVLGLRPPYEPILHLCLGWPEPAS